MNGDFRALEQKIDRVAADLDQKIDRVAANLDQKINRVAAGLEQKLEQKIDAAVAELRLEIERVLNLIAHQSGEFHADLQRMEERSNTTISARYEALERRLALHAGLIQSGSRAITRFVEWSSGTDEGLGNALLRLQAVESQMARRNPPAPPSA